MYLQDFVFLNDTSTDTTSNALVVNSKAETLKLSVEGASVSNLVVQGKVNRDSATFFDLAVINLSSFATAAKIENSGLYAVDVQGIKEVRVKHSGSAGGITVYGVVV